MHEFQKFLIYLFLSYHCGIQNSEIAEIISLLPTWYLTRDGASVCQYFTFIGSSYITAYLQKNNIFLALLLGWTSPHCIVNSQCCSCQQNQKNTACNSRIGHEGYIISLGERCTICFQSDLIYCFHGESKIWSIHAGLLLCLVKKKYNLTSLWKWVIITEVKYLQLVQTVCDVFGHVMLFRFTWMHYGLAFICNLVSLKCISLKLCIK